MRSLIATALVALLFAGIRFGPRTASKLNMLYWQSSCLDYDFPPGTLVYSEDPADAARLSRDPLYRTLPVIPEAAVRVFRNAPQPWERFHPLIAPEISFRPPLEPTIILFVHQRTTVGGIRQLVVVGLDVKDHNDPIDPVPTTRLAVIVKQFSLGTFSHDAPCVVSSSLFGQGDTAFTACRLRFFAGKADPKNSAKFTIPWEFNGTRHQMQGTIHDESDHDPTIPNVSLQDIP